MIFTANISEVPQNCEDCRYRRMRQDPKEWCYMFEQKPEGRCLQHKKDNHLNEKGI